MSRILSRVCMDNIVDTANALQSSIYTSIQYYIIPTTKFGPYCSPFASLLRTGSSRTGILNTRQERRKENVKMVGW